jgi:hypothetical protein
LTHLGLGFISELSFESDIDFLLFVSEALDVRLSFMDIVGGVFEGKRNFGARFKIWTILRLAPRITNLTVNKYLNKTKRSSVSRELLWLRLSNP